MGLSDVQEAMIVHLIDEGDDIPSNIADSTGYHRNSVVRAAKPLVEKGMVENKGGGVYRLTEDGRQTARDLKNSAE